MILTHNTKSTVMFLLVVLLALSFLPLTAFSADYSSHWARASIERAIQMGWFAKNPLGTYRPDDFITRAEFITMINRMKAYSGEADLSGFSDVKEGDWYYSEFSAAVAVGYIQGCGAMLNPSSKITRNEAVAIFTRIYELEPLGSIALANVRDGAEIPEWARSYVAAAISEGIIDGYEENFNGGGNITRAETAVLLERLYDNVRTYCFAGTYTGSAGHVIVKAAGVTLQDMKILGDLTIAASVGDGEVVLENITVDGKLDVQGGGKNSVYINNSQIASIVVTKDEVRIVFQDGTIVTHVNLEGSDVEIIIGSGAYIDSIIVETSANLVLKNGAMVGELTVAEAAAGTNIATESGAIIEAVTVAAADTEISGPGVIVTANIKAENVVIEQRPETTVIDTGITANVGGANVAAPANQPNVVAPVIGGASSTSDSNNIPVSGVSINDRTVNTGSSTQLTASIIPSNATNNTVTWTISSRTGAADATLSTSGIFAAGSATGTVIVKAASVSTPTQSDTAIMTIVNPTQDNADISTAKVIVEGVTYTAAQAEVTDIATAKTAVETIINRLSLNGVTTTIVDGDFSAAGAVGNAAGTDGFYTFTVKLNKGVGTEQTTGLLTLTIKAAAYVFAVSGTVTSAAPGNAPIEGAAVTLNNGADDFTGTTDTNGEFSIDVPAGTYAGTVIKSGYQDETISQFTVSAAVTGKDITLIPKRMLTFDTQCDVLNPSEQFILHGGLAIDPGNPTRVGYDFLGWYKESDGGEKWDFDSDDVESDMILYAQWEEVKYTLALSGSSSTPEGQGAADAFFNTETNELYCGVSTMPTLLTNSNSISILKALGTGNRFTIPDGVVTLIEITETERGEGVEYNFSGVDLTDVRITVQVIGRALALVPKTYISDVNQVGLQPGDEIVIVTPPTITNAYQKIGVGVEDADYKCVAIISVETDLNIFKLTVTYTGGN